MNKRPSIDMSIRVADPVFNQEIFYRALMRNPFEKIYGEVSLMSNGVSFYPFHKEGESENDRLLRHTKYIDDCEKQDIIPFSTADFSASFNNHYVQDWQKANLHFGPPYLTNELNHRIERLNEKGGKIHWKRFLINHQDNDLFISRALLRNFSLGYQVSDAKLKLQADRDISIGEREEGSAITILGFDDQKGLECKLGAALNSRERSKILDWFSDLADYNFQQKIENYQHRLDKKE